MRITNEKYEVAFMSDVTQEVEKLIQEYGFEYEGAESEFLVVKIEDNCKVKTLVEALRALLKKDGDDQYTIGISNEYDVIFEDEEEAYTYMQTMFKPNFKCEDFCISKISFYTEVENNVYIVEIDYGFDEGMQVKARKFIEDEKLKFVFEAFDQLQKKMFQEVKL